MNQQHYYPLHAPYIKMQEPLLIDFTKPVLDLTYEHLETIEMNQQAESVRALILTGNPISDFSFLDNFLNLQLLHCDQINIQQLFDLRISKLPKLVHLILRLNMIKDFQNLDDSESLQLIDFSQNNFERGIEQSFESQFPNIKQLLFGFSTFQPVNKNLVSCSRTHLNIFQLFIHAFLLRFYQQNQIFFSRIVNEQKQLLLLSNLQFEQYIQNNKLIISVKKIQQSDRILNTKLIFGFYAIITGFEIQLIEEKVVQLSELADGYDINLISQFKAKQTIYPTSESNTNENDQSALQLNQNRQQLQLDEFTNFNLVTVEYDKQIGVILMYKEKMQFIEYEDALQLIEKHINVMDGLKVVIVKADYHNKTANQQIVNNEEYIKQQQQRDNIINQSFMPLHVKIDNKLQLEEIMSKSKKQIMDYRKAADSVYQIEPDKSVHLNTANKLENTQQFTKPFQIAEQDVLMTTNYLNNTQDEEPQQETLNISIQHTDNKNYMQTPYSKVPMISDMHTHDKSTYNSIDQSQKPLTDLFFTPYPINANQLIKIAPAEKILFVHYYVSTISRNQMATDLQQQLSQLKNIQYSQATIQQIISKSIIKFNSSQQKQNSDNFQSIYVEIEHEGVKMPLKMPVRKVFVANRNQSFQISPNHFNFYVVANIYQKNQNKLIISPSAVQFIPKISSVEFQRLENKLITTVFEQIQSGFVESQYKNFWYCWYVNNELIQESKNASIQIKGQGVFKVVVMVRDDEGCVVGNEYESDQHYFSEHVALVRAGTKIEEDVTNKVANNDIKDDIGVVEGFD